MTEDRRHRNVPSNTPNNNTPNKPSQPRPKPEKAKAAVSAASGSLRAPGSAADPWVAVGTIVGAFGIRGDVKIQPLTDFPERFERTPTLHLGDKRTPHAVASARLHKRIVVAHLAGIETANDAEKLRGVTVYVRETELVALPADSYYLHDLIGLRVEHVDGTPLGVVADVVGAGGNDLFVVRTPAGNDVLLPAVKEFVKAVDIRHGVMRVAPIPGLFDDNAEVADVPGMAEGEAADEGHEGGDELERGEREFGG